MIKAASSKARLVRINLVILILFLMLYASLLLWPSSSIYHENAASLVRCTLRECHHHTVDNNGIKMKTILEEPQTNSQRALIKRDKPSFLNQIGQGMKIGMINMEDEDTTQWELNGKTIKIHFDHISKYFEWKDLFPEWIDEEEEFHGPSCPEIPMPYFEDYDYMDLIVAKLPCEYGVSRDVFRLQVHLIVANLLVKRGKKDWNGKKKVVFLSKCMAMMEFFRCDDLVKHEGDWWYYEPEMVRLEQKVELPYGSCNLALPLWGKGIDRVFDVSKIEHNTNNIKREAYATVLHSTDAYVCGAITLAQSLLQTNTKRDLILLIDNSISLPNRQALAKAGWTIRMIERIRNPKAEKDSYNEYNYSKFRLWQLTDYDKIIFIDSDIIVLKNLDVLFHFPQMTATGNDGSIFNSGIMVIEPSNCTFANLMDRVTNIVSYNGGDQGFLNEIFVYWHRLPRRVNFLKNFWANTTGEESVKNELIRADPPKVYAIHFLGLKPWLCYRDYDCNWDLPQQRSYASDIAHRRWWRFHDAMDEGLQKFCDLSHRRRIELKWDRLQAEKMGLQDEHWKINVTDPRQYE